MSKVKTLMELGGIVSKLKKEGRVIIFTNGCFDIIHPGHIKILKEAKKKGDILIVGLNSDSSVKKNKGKKRPILDEGARKEILNAIKFVDYIVLFSEKTPRKLIKKIRPHYLIKGDDWEKGKIVGREFVKKVFRIPLRRGYSTSEIIDKIVKEYG